MNQRSDDIPNIVTFSPRAYGIIYTQKIQSSNCLPQFVDP